MEQILFSALTFVLGAAVGSFLNVVIFRLPQGLEIFRKRSFCPYCKTPLGVAELVPIFSYFYLGGHCKTCGKPISAQYPIVETATAALFLASFLFWLQKYGLDFQFLPQLFLWFLTVSVLIVVFVIDLRFGIIPDQIIKFAVLASLVLILASYFFEFLGSFFSITRGFGELGKYLFQPLLLNHFKLAGLDFATRVLSAVGVVFFFMVLILVTKGKGMGWGDVKFGFWLGLIFSLPQILQVVFLSFVTGATVSIILILAKLKKFGQTVPFGPFLSIAALASLFFGEKILSWYLSVLGLKNL